MELLEKVGRAGDVKSFRFTRPEGFDYDAGQFFFIRLNDNLMKHFSFSTSPTEENLEFTTRMTGSDFKNALDALKTGETVELRGPRGEFTYGGEQKMAFLTGGIGITPIRSITKYVLDEGLDCDIVLLYGNRDEHNIPFREELDGWGEDNGNFRLTHVLEKPKGEWDGHTGYITKDVVQSEISDFTDRVFYVCGPPKMSEAMKDILDGLNVPEDKIKLENFTGY